MNHTGKLLDAIRHINDEDENDSDFRGDLQTAENLIREVIGSIEGFDLCAECGHIGQGFVVKQRETWSPEVGDHLVEQSLCGNCQELGV